MAKNLYDTYNNEQDSLPRSSAGTGTISNAFNNSIIGVGTVFTTQLNEGDWIYIPGQNDFRQIENIVSNTELTLESAFGVALAGSAFKYVTRPSFRKVSWLITAGPATIDGEAFPTNSSDTIEADAAKGKKASGDYVDPIDIDATGATVKTSCSF